MRRHHDPGAGRRRKDHQWEAIERVDVWRGSGEDTGDDVYKEMEVDMACVG